MEQPIIAFPFFNFTFCFIFVSNSTYIMTFPKNNILECFNKLVKFYLLLGCPKKLSSLRSQKTNSCFP